MKMAKGVSGRPDPVEMRLVRFEPWNSTYDHRAFMGLTL